MDEATSSLDVGTEREIIDEIQNYKKDKTIIVIAHRYSTVKLCDSIYLLKDGVLIKKDNYNETVLE